MATIRQIEERRAARREAKQAGVSLHGIPLSERYTGTADNRLTYNKQNNPALSPIQSPTSAPTATTTPTMPTPTAPGVESNYMTSTTENQANLRKRLEELYASQKADATSKLEDAKVERAGYLSKMDPTTRPTYDQEQKIMQNQVSAAETASSTIEQNFMEKQRLIGELEKLLTQGNTAIEAQKKAPVSMRVLGSRVNNTIQDVAARTGVIEAVLSARDGQIAQAHNIINQAKDTVKANWNDRLQYYDTLLAYNNQDIVSLTEEQKDIAEREMSLIENDLEKVDKTADYIQKLMIDPDTASFIADAGVKLTDSIEEINTKMATQAKVREVADFKKDMALKGYKFSPVPAAGYSPVVVGGQTLYVNKTGSGVTSDVPATFEEYRQQEETKLRDLIKQNRPDASESAIDFFIKSNLGDLRSKYNALKSGNATGKAYTAVNIPAKVKNELIYDIKNAATLQELYEAYPEVSTSYINSLFNSLQKKSGTSESLMSEEELDRFLNSTAPTI